jgi:type I restriction enzyme S subunit
MRDGEKYRLGDLCKIVKGETPIKQAIPGRYPLVVTAAQRASHEAFQFDCRAVIVPLVSSTGHGHASIKRINYQEGKFALGSILCAVIPKDEKRLNAKFLHVYFSYFKDQLIVPLMKGSANVSLSLSTLAELKIIVPPMDVQERVISLAENDDLMKPLEHEITHQQSLLAKLKQAILQEAIQGKLTADWRAAHPDVEPASQLLHRIQAEKARLTAAKKLRPEKTLPKITPAEIPFEIPKGWEWCRLKELGRWCGGGTPTKDVDRFWGNEVPWITPKDMKQPFLSDSQLKLTRNGVEESSAKLIPAKSILFVVRGMILAHTFPVSVNLVETTVNQDMKALMPFLPGLEVFLRLLLESSSQRILSVVTKSTHGTRKLETEVYENFVIPLPPLAEQAAIVERVEALMTTCRLLEAEIAAARTHAAHLLQAVLKEAFAPAAKVAA